jgi:hypothetical protein
MARDLGPEAALLRIVHNDFDLHAGFPKDYKKIHVCACNGKI